MGGKVVQWMEEGSLFESPGTEGHSVRSLHAHVAHRGTDELATLNCPQV